MRAQVIAGVIEARERQRTGDERIFLYIFWKLGS